MFDLAICIPTYNRANYLPTLLDSILAQTNTQTKIQICISDNASEDHTKDIIEAYKKKFTAIIYHRNKSNIGPDKNFLKCIALANSRFCWLMGSDDKLEKKAITNLLAFLKNNPTISGCSVDLNSYDYTLSECQATHVMSRHTHLSHTFNVLKDTTTILSLLGGYLGFLSGQVINKALWDEVIANHNIEPFFNAYVHVYIMAMMLKKNALWGFIATPCIGARSGNDSFASNGLYKRAMIDIEGFESIAREVFGAQSLTYKKWISKVISQPIFWCIMKCKQEHAPGTAKLFFICLKKYYLFPVFWYKLLPIFVAPKSLARWLLNIARWLKRR